MRFYWVEEDQEVCRECLTFKDAEVCAINSEQFLDLRAHGPVLCTRCGEEWVCYGCSNVGVPREGCAVCGLLREGYTRNDRARDEGRDRREMDKYIEHLKQDPEFNRRFEARRAAARGVGR